MGDRTLPSGVVTFVLTDVVGSTRLWEQAPEAMERALARHDEIVDQAVGEHGGVLLKQRGEGDSTFSVFARASDALRAAAAVQLAVRGERWSGGVSIAVRIAVHSGEAVERDGEFLGTAVNRAARLRDVCAGGEVIVSATTASLVADRGLDPLELVDAGEVRLRGLDGSQTACFLVAPGLPAARRLLGPAAGPELGDLGITRREAEVLDALAGRLTNAEIAARLYISERTVESHVSSLLRKLGAGNRRELGEVARAHATSSRRAAPPLPPALEVLADPATCVGRAEERHRLRALWDRACRGQARAVVVTGEAGIGKSRLVAELAREVHTSGGRVLLGACFEDLQLPYEPFARALADEAAATSRAEVRHRAGGSAAALARLLPGLASTLPPVTEERRSDDLVERAEGFAAVHAYLTSMAAAAPTLFVIEDLHWATVGTRELLRHLARVGGHVPLLIVATSRDVAPDLGHDLAVFLADLAALPGVETMRLTGLAADEVADLVTVLAGEGDPGAIVSDTAGNPLLVRELVAAGTGVSSASLPSLLGRRYALLGGDDLDVLDVAAVVGTEFEADLLAGALDRPLGQVLESLERAEAAGLVTPSPGVPGRFSFVHGLFRTARYDDIPVGRRIRLHRQVAWVLRDHSEDDRILPALARHACEAARLGDARPAVQYARRAGEVAERALALDEAALHYRRGLDVAGLLSSPDPGLRLRLAIRLGRVLNRMGDPSHRQILLQAAADARAIGDALGLAEVAWAMSQDGTPTTPGRSDPEFVAIAEDALAGLGEVPTVERARAMAALAADLNIGGDPQRAFQLARDALTIARSVDDPMALAQVLLATRTTRWVPGSPDAGHRTADELLAIGRATGQTTFTLYGWFERALACREAGDLGGYGEAVDALGDILGRVTVPYAYIRVLEVCLRSTRQALAGDLSAAEETLAELAPLARGGGFDVVPWRGPSILMIRHHQGRLAERLPGLEHQQPGFRDFGDPVLALAGAHAGRDGDARAIVRRIAGSTVDRPPNPHSLSGLVLLCEAVEMTGDGDAAAQLAPRLEPFRGLIAGVFSTAIGPVDLALAQLALAAGDEAVAEAHAERAVDASRRRGTPVYLARELVRLAEARRRRGAPRAAVRPLVDEAVAIAGRTGAALVVHEARRFELLPPG